MKNNGRFKKGSIPWNKGVKYSKEFVKEHKIGLQEGSINALMSVDRSKVDTNSAKRKETILKRYGKFPGNKGKTKKPEVTKECLHCGKNLVNPHFKLEDKNVVH